MIDLMSIAQSIYSGLAKELITHLHRTVRKPFEVPEKEKAVDRCLKTATEAAILQLKPFEETDQKRLAELLQQFFDDSDVIRELSKILIRKPLNMTELADIYMEIANHENIAGFDIEAIVRVFAESFRDAAAQEKELVDSLIFGETAKQTIIQTDQLAETKAHTKIQEAISKNVEKLANQKETAEKQQAESAKSLYLKSLAKECLNLPLSALGEDTSDDDGVTLDAVYVDLDTTSTYMVDEKGNRISDRTAMQRMDEKKIKTKTLTVREAAVENSRLMLLGDPGAGKSAFVKKLSALVAQDLLGVNVHPEDCFKGLLPIFIQLRDLVPRLQTVNISKPSADERTAHLLRVVNEQLSKNLYRLNANAFRDGIFDALHQGNCLLVLDGLDEVPFKQRKRIQLTVNALISNYAPKRMIITCRIRSYTGHNRLSGFQEYTIADLNNEKIKRFITAWYNAKKALGKIDTETAKIRIADLLKGAIKLRALAKNPMMLTTMAIIHYNQHQLPDERVKLYKLVVDILLRRWRKENLGVEGLRISANLAKVLADDKKLQELAARLGYEAQSTGKKEQETADINRDQAILLLKNEGYLDSYDLAEEFLDYVDQHSGLLIGRGGESDPTEDDEKEAKPVAYGFYHRSFQEYLAGCQIVSQRNIPRELIQHSEEGDYWAPTIQFGMEELYYNEARRGVLTLQDLAHTLCQGTKPETEAIERQVLWASNIAVLLTPEEIAKDPKFPNGGRAYLDRLRRSLAQLLSGKLPFEERAEAGRNLAKMGTEQELDALKINPVFSLRKAATELSVDQTKAMLKKFDFADTYENKEGNGCVHVYQAQKGGKVVMDYAAGLMWQQSGSSNRMAWKDCQQYIDQLNGEKYAGYSDWRLPTLEEAMSLMEREKKNGDLYIDPEFDAKQRSIWTADRHSASGAWSVYFDLGLCSILHVDYSYYARAVRS